MAPFRVPVEWIDRVIREIQDEYDRLHAHNMAERGKTTCAYCGDPLLNQPGPICMDCRED